MSTQAEVYCVGQIRAIAQPVEGYDIEVPQLWEFTGVFPTMDAAVTACRDWTYFVFGPVPVGMAAPHETSPDFFPCVFPIERPAESALLPGEVYDVPA